jgi:hypothetical protein
VFQHSIRHLVGYCDKLGCDKMRQGQQQVESRLALKDETHFLPGEIVVGYSATICQPFAAAHKAHIA